MIDEDTPPRYINHFYNPSSSAGLPEASYTWAFAVGIELKLESKASFEELVAVGKAWAEGDYKLPKIKRQSLPLYQSALTWARDGMGDGLDWKGAIETYDYTPESKLRAYTAVGHVLHLIQDMAQPDHARNRAHPCNSIGGWLNQHGVTDRVGYEELWSRRSLNGAASWPKGTNVQKFSTLEKFFTNLAYESQQQEDKLHLPHAGEEQALGCKSVIWRLGEAGPTGTVLGANLIRIILQHGFDTLSDTSWQEAELAGLPDWPNISTDSSDPDNKAYTTLGQVMLPKAEEYGAGLLQFFHDIVNQPPFVEKVEIYQGELKYRKTWKDDETGDPPHVQSRHAEVEGGELEAGVEAELTIRIGPKDPDPKLNDTFIRRELKSLKVTVVPDGGKPEDEILVPVREQGDEKSPRGGIWKGHFTPSRSAALRIEAVDLNQHFKDEGGQREQSLTPVDGKRGTQGDVDSDPSTPARATWRESKVAGMPAGVPYPWKGYEAGPDTNHHFTVRSVCGSFGQKELEAMRWGTWTGTVVAHARDNTPFPLDAQLSVSFRAAFETARVGSVKRDSDVYDLNSDLQSALSVPGLIRFGRLRGSGTWTELDHSVPGYGKCTLSGTLAPLYGGYMDFDADPQFRSIPQLYVVLRTERAKSPGLGCNGNSVEIQLVGGEVCPDGRWRGNLTREDVQRVHDQYSAAKSLRMPFRTISDNLDIRIGWGEAPKGWSDLSWNLQFTASAMPPHVQDVVNFQKWQKAIVAGLGAYGQQLKVELMPILVDLGKAGKLNEWKQLNDAWHSQGNPCAAMFSYTTPQSWQDFQAANGMLSELWLAHWYPAVGGIGAPEKLSDADLDQQYADQLKKLEAAVAQFRPVKLSSETKCALETEKLATVVEAVSPNSTSTVQSLRELANKIRKTGIESLASGNP